MKELLTIMESECSAAKLHCRRHLRQSFLFFSKQCINLQILFKWSHIFYMTSIVGIVLFL